MRKIFSLIHMFLFCLTAILSEKNNKIIASGINNENKLSLGIENNFNLGNSGNVVAATQEEKAEEAGNSGVNEEVEHSSDAKEDAKTEGKQEVEKEHESKMELGSESELESEMERKADVDTGGETEEKAEAIASTSDKGGSEELQVIQEDHKSEGQDMNEDESLTSSMKKEKMKEEDELNELKKLEEFKQGEMIEKGGMRVNNVGASDDKDEVKRENRSDKYEDEEGKATILSETIDEDQSKANINEIETNKYSIGVSSINQVVNAIIQPSSGDEKQFQIEMKEEADNESEMDENKQTKSVIMTFDLSADILLNKIPLISESELIFTRYTGITPQNIRITILDPTINLDNSQIGLSEIQRFDTTEYELENKVPSKPDAISLDAISSQIPIILQQFNTSNFRLLLEAKDTQTQFGILSNIGEVGPILKIELKPTIESNSTWMYTITGVAIIFVIIGVSVALYFQNKNKESSQKAENMPLLGNKV